MSDLSTKTPLTARIHVVHGGHAVLMDGKRFLFARNFTDVQVLDDMLKYLGVVTVITETY